MNSTVNPNIDFNITRPQIKFPDNDSIRQVTEDMIEYTRIVFPSFFK